MLAGNLSAQRITSETQRATRTGLRNFAVHVRVQLPGGAALQGIEESVLRSRIEGALRREGISIETRNDVRDGSQASLDLLYLVLETRDTSGRSSDSQRRPASRYGPRVATPPRLIPT